MNNEEKILDLLASLHVRMDTLETGLNARMDTLETGLNARMDTLENHMDSMSNHMDSIDIRMDTLENHMDSMSNHMDSIDTRMDALETGLLKVNIKLETDIEVRLDALAEGHEAILERLVPRSRVDDLEEEVRFLKLVVRQMGDDIAQLKQAQ